MMSVRWFGIESGIVASQTMCSWTFLLLTSEAGMAGHAFKIVLVKNMRLPSESLKCNGSSVEVAADIGDLRISKCSLMNSFSHLNMEFLSWKMYQWCIELLTEILDFVNSKLVAGELSWPQKSGDLRNQKWNRYWNLDFVNS